MILVEVGIQEVEPGNGGVGAGDQKLDLARRVELHARNQKIGFRQVRLTDQVRLQPPAGGEGSAASGQGVGASGVASSRTTGDP